jgi:hypothetical protein
MDASLVSFFSSTKPRARKCAATEPAATRALRATSKRCRSKSEIPVAESRRPSSSSENCDSNVNCGASALRARSTLRSFKISTRCGSAWLSSVSIRSQRPVTLNFGELGNKSPPGAARSFRKRSWRRLVFREVEPIDGAAIIGDGLFLDAGERLRFEERVALAQTTRALAAKANPGSSPPAGPVSRSMKVRPSFRTRTPRERSR